MDDARTDGSGTGMPTTPLPPFARAMLEPPSLAATLGITLVALAPGRATCRLVITGEHVNQAAVTHGGAVFALADTAIGLASSREDGPVPLGTSFSLQILRATRPGDALLAEAVEEHRGRRLVSQRVVLHRAADRALVATATAQLLLTPEGRHDRGGTA